MSAQLHRVKANIILIMINKELKNCFNKAFLETEEQENPTEMTARDFKKRCAWRILLGPRAAMAETQQK